MQTTRTGSSSKAAFFGCGLRAYDLSLKHVSGEPQNFCQGVSFFRIQGPEGTSKFGRDMKGLAISMMVSYAAARVGQALGGSNYQRRLFILAM